MEHGCSVWGIDLDVYYCRAMHACGWSPEWFITTRIYSCWGMPAVVLALIYRATRSNNREVGCFF